VFASRETVTRYVVYIHCRYSVDNNNHVFKQLHDFNVCRSAHLNSGENMVTVMVMITRNHRQSYRRADPLRQRPQVAQHRVTEQPL